MGRHDFGEVLDRSENPVSECIIEAQHHDRDECHEDDYAPGLLRHLSSGRPGDFAGFIFDFVQKQDGLFDAVAGRLGAILLGSFLTVSGATFVVFVLRLIAFFHVVHGSRVLVTLAIGWIGLAARCYFGFVLFFARHC